MRWINQSTTRPSRRNQTVASILHLVPRPTHTLATPAGWSPPLSSCSASTPCGCCRCTQRCAGGSKLGQAWWEGSPPFPPDWCASCRVAAVAALKGVRAGASSDMRGGRALLLFLLTGAPVAMWLLSLRSKVSKRGSRLGQAWRAQSQSRRVLLLGNCEVRQLPCGCCRCTQR